MKHLILIVLSFLAINHSFGQYTLNFTNQIDCEVEVEFGIEVSPGVFMNAPVMTIYGYNIPCVTTCPYPAGPTNFMDVGAPWAPNNMSVIFSNTVYNMLTVTGSPQFAMRIISLNGIPTLSSPWVTSTSGTITYSSMGTCTTVYGSINAAGFLVTM